MGLIPEKVKIMMFRNMINRFKKKSRENYKEPEILEKFYGEIGYAFYDLSTQEYSFDSNPIIRASDNINGFEDPFIFDPFYVEYKGEKLLFYELCGTENNKYSCVIACSLISDDGSVIDTNIVLRPEISGKKFDAADYTISYPFPIKNDNNLYFVCEQYYSGSTNLYKYNNTRKKEFEFFARLWDGLRDPNIEFSDNRYWLYGIDKNYNIIVLFSDNIIGPYKEHTSSKKYQGKTFARNAGMTFKLNGKKIRPFQNCNNIYGETVGFGEYQLTLKEGLVLIDNDLKIKEIKGNSQNPKWIRSKSHHFCPIEISGLGIKAVIDGGKMRKIYSHGWEKFKTRGG